MKTLQQYLDEADEKFNPPVVGDNFAIELDDVLIESYIVDIATDGYVIAADDRVLELLEHCGCTEEQELQEQERLMEIPQELESDYGDPDIAEAKYQGREVPLGKPMAGDVKKSKVYVKGPKGNVVKVNFGDKKMRIKKNIPGRRKNFRARHNCDNPGPRWKARYWSCRAW